RLLPEVELSSEVLDEIRRRCQEAGVILEEADDVDLVALEGGLPDEVGTYRNGRAAAAARRRAPIGGKKSGENVASTSHPGRMYLREIGRVPLLTAQGEVDLAIRIKAGVEASDRLAEAEAAGAGEGPGGAGGGSLSEKEAAELQWLADDGDAAKNA